MMNKQFREVIDKTKQLDGFIKLSINQAAPTGLGFATRNYLGAQGLEPPTSTVWFLGFDFFLPVSYVSCIYCIWFCCIFATFWPSKKHLSISFVLCVPCVFPDCNTFATPIIVNPDEQLNNKILGGHGSLSFQLSLTRIVSVVRDSFKSKN